MSELQNEIKIKLHGLWIDVARSLGLDVEMVFLSARHWIDNRVTLGSIVKVMIPKHDIQLEVRLPVSVEIVTERVACYDIIRFVGLTGQIRGAYGYNVYFQATDAHAVVKGED